MADDIRGIPTTSMLAEGKLVATASSPAGFTAGATYWPLGVAYDATTGVVYLLTVDDAGALRAVAASAFTLRLPAS